MSDIDFEIAWRELLLKRLKNPLKLLRSAQDKEQAEILKRTQELAQYESYEDAHEAYAYAEITSDELERIRKMFERTEDNPEITVIDAATDELQKFVNRLRSDIRCFKWEKLTPEEQRRIEQESEERRLRYEARKNST
ncbi:MAG: hypothetical protein LBL82_00290 [Oscillospiraceae bacterium]|jgi:hypothetical protein|nr:hypothetical protein [Oscillospiraceae bacterium]